MARISKNQAVKVYCAVGGDRVLERTDMETAERRERAGVYRREYDNATGLLRGFRVISMEERRMDVDLRSMPSPAAISAREMELNAGCAGRSRTVGLREEKRVALRDPEDRVERVRAKVRVYAQITSAKGDIMRVWPL